MTIQWPCSQQMGNNLSLNENNRIELLHGHMRWRLPAVHPGETGGI